MSSDERKTQGPPRPRGKKRARAATHKRRAKRLIGGRMTPRIDELRQELRERAEAEEEMLSIISTAIVDKGLLKELARKSSSSACSGDGVVFDAFVRIRQLHQELRERAEYCEELRRMVDRQASVVAEQEEELGA